MRVLVVTIVHHPHDARIHRRQIGALVDAGDEVTYAAPWTAFEAEPTAGFQTRDLPRATGRRRMAAIRAARALVRREGPSHDIVLVHDPDLLLAVRGYKATPVVWDVHEDTAAALVDRAWMPAGLEPMARRAVRRAERWAERNLHLLLAEAAYAERFVGEHPVVPNVPVVPESVPAPGIERVVHVGRISRGRGWAELRAVGELLREHDVRVELLGPADADVEAEVREAADDGAVDWHGYVPNEQALARLEGALAGLCLLHDLPNYRHSMPTKVVEYMAAGVPAVTTPLPLARDLVELSGGGVVVPFADADRVVSAVLRLRDDEALRTQAGAAGHAHALEHMDWRVEGPSFVQLLRRWAESRT